MALLIDKYYKLYKKEGLKVPYEIVKFTDEYRKECDLYSDFLLTYLEDAGDSSLTETVDISSLYEQFKVWYEDNYGNKKCDAKNNFKKNLKSKYGTKRCTDKELRGFRFKGKLGELNNNNNNNTTNNQNTLNVIHNVTQIPKEINIVDELSLTAQSKNPSNEEVKKEGDPKKENMSGY
jgi:hypothetical protein